MYVIHDNSTVHYQLNFGAIPPPPDLTTQQQQRINET
jgi:hypothetical protein